MTELIKYKATDTVLQSLQDQNTNMDIISTELAKKMDKTGEGFEGDLKVGGKLIFGDTVSLAMHGTDKLVLEAPVTILPNDLYVAKQIEAGAVQASHLRVKGDVYLAGRYIKKTASIPTSGWESVSGAYPKRYKLMVDGLKATDYLDIVIDKASMAVAQKAELCPSVEESEGYAYIYAKKVPTSALSVSYKVVI